MARPAASASEVRGAAPTATTTSPAGIASPPETSTRPASTPSTDTPSRRSTPCSRCRSAKAEPIRGAHHAQQRLRLRLDDGDLAADRAGSGGHLEADPPGPDDDHGRLLLERRAQGRTVVEGAQVGHPRAALVGRREATRFGAGRQEQLVVADLAAVRRDHALREVDRGHRDGRTDLHVVVGVPGGVVHLRGVGLLLPQQHALRQRRTFVGQVRLGAEQRHLAVVPPLPQLLDGLRPGQSASDDHDAHARLTFRSGSGPGTRRGWPGRPAAARTTPT